MRNRTSNKQIIQWIILVASLTFIVVGCGGEEAITQNGSTSAENAASTNMDSGGNVNTSSAAETADRNLSLNVFVSYGRLADKFTHSFDVNLVR